MTVKFPLGRIVATPGALAMLEAAGRMPMEFLDRHVSGDWGTMDAEDRAANDRAVLEGSRILSAYPINAAETLWIITEWDRSVTTLLLPEDY